MTISLLSRPWLVRRPDGDTGSGAGDAGGTGDQAQAAGAGSPGGGDTGSQTNDQTAVLKSEAQKLRARLREAEAERDKLAAAQKSDAEKLADRAAKAEERVSELEGRLRSQALRSAIADARTQVGIVASPATLARLIDPESIEWTDDGEPEAKSLVGALRGLAKSDPALVRQGSADGGAGGRRASTAADMNSLIREGAGRAA